MAAALFTAFACSNERDPDAYAIAAVDSSALEVEVRIDGVAEDLVPIGMILVATNGTMIVTQSQDARLRFFGADGRALGSFGGSGEGPGEFRSIARIGWLNDTLWVLDSQLARFSLITDSGQLARTIMAPMHAGPSADDIGQIPEFPLAIPIALLPGGDIHALLSPAVGQDVPERFQDASTYGVISAEGIVKRIVAQVPSHPDCCVRADGARGISTASVPLTNRSRYIASSNGRLGVRAVELQRSTGPVIAVTVVTMRGDTVFGRTYSVESIPVAASVRDSLSRSRIAQLQQASPELADAYRKQARIPETYPAVVDLIAGRDDSVWIQVATDDDVRTYLALDAGGEPLGRLTLPSNSRISVAEANRIWVLERDADDVQSVVRYHIRW